MGLPQFIGPSPVSSEDVQRAYPNDRQTSDLNNSENFRQSGVEFEKEERSAVVVPYPYDSLRIARDAPAIGGACIGWLFSSIFSEIHEKMPLSDHEASMGHSGRRTTYIFGAGASFHAGYPFAKSMGRELLQWMKLHREHPYFDFRQSAEYLEARFGNDIEGLVAGVQRAVRKREVDGSVIANVHKPAIQEAIREWFCEIHQRDHARYYQGFAVKIVQPGDCVITFNYDVSLDFQLRRAGKWAVGDGYGFLADGLPKGSSVKILKLHGSVNWLAILFGGMSGSFCIGSGGAFGSRPVFTDGDLSALGHDGATGPLFPRTGAAGIQPLILPTSRKQFFFETSLGREWGPFWNRLWRAARKAVRTSDRVVICGYGLYPVDRRGCNLLLEGELNGDVEVCCGGDTDRIVSELRLHGRRAAPAEYLCFEDWVRLQCVSKDISA